ncbi:MAG: HAMP domain-containing protein [Deltaproteobacteria bacterium]|nr:HAMP domain-containing protein [Deltaproteobacteria bacterium]
MRVPRLTVESTFLNSRVARRVFWTVSICSLLPIAAFALFSLIQVRGQLDSDASNALRSNLKESAVSILGRLRLADEALQLRIGETSADGSVVALETTRLLRTARAATPSDPEILRLAADVGPRLSAGRHLLVVDEAAAEPRVVLLRAVAPPGLEIWIAEVDPDFLFEPDRYSERDHFAVRDSKGRLIFSAPETWQAPRTVAPAGPQGVAAETRGGGFLTLSRFLLPGNDLGETEWLLSLGRPLSDIHRPLREFESIFPWVVGITLCLALGLALAQIRRILVPIEALMSGARRIADGEFDTSVEVTTDDEFESLSESFNQMATVIGKHIRVLNTTNAIGAALSAESNADRLIELILTGSMNVTGGTAGVIFLVDDEMGLSPTLTIVDGDGVSDERSTIGTHARGLAARCLERRTTQLTDRRQDRDALDQRTWSRIEERLGARVAGCMAVPMSTEKKEPIGALLLFRAGTENFSDADAALASSLASQAAVAVQKNRLVENFRSLFEGVVDLTVRAIDEKSQYTGDHCRKVPILTELIADAACDDRTGPLKDFTLNADERYELRIAALLHDCGKVVTPVHVMDKGTKLEAISDRIEVIETRFELLRADARIRALHRQLAARGADPTEDEVRELTTELASLDDDLEFVRLCNRGQESMSSEDCDRIREIAARLHWIDGRNEAREVLDSDDVGNLTIRRGTLNGAERQIIQEHVVLTMQMLEALPWPRELSSVPAIAGAHHERVDGRGYPLGLDASQLSVQARILGLADIFEALTAKSRPYKPGRTLTETLGILDQMASEGHIDAGLYELFIREKLHLKYSIQHVAPGQIDGAHQAMVERLTDPTDARGEEPG